MHTGSLASSFSHLVWYCALFYIQVLLEIVQNCEDRCNNPNLNICPFWARADALWFCMKDYSQYCFDFFVQWILCQIIDLQNCVRDWTNLSALPYTFYMPQVWACIYSIQDLTWDPFQSHPVTYCVTQALLRGSRGRSTAPASKLYGSFHAWSHPLSSNRNI